MNSWTQTLLLVLLWFNILAESLSTHHSTLIRPLYGVGLASIQMEPSAESTRLNTSFHPTFEGRLVLQRLIEEILLEYKSSSDQCISREFKFPTANDQPFCPANKYNIWVSRNNSLDASQLWQATREIFNTKILENYCTKAALDRIDTKENRAKIITTSPGDSLITPILPTPTPAPTDLNLGASFKGSIQSKQNRTKSRDVYVLTPKCSYETNSNHRDLHWLLMCRTHCYLRVRSPQCF